MELTFPKSQNSKKSKKSKLTRYRVTLDVMVDRTICDAPNSWDWKQILDMDGKEQVNDVYVEKMGEYFIKWMKINSSEY